jgi:hypothetical protein
MKNSVRQPPPMIANSVAAIGVNPHDRATEVTENTEEDRSQQDKFEWSKPLRWRFA